MDNFFLRSLRAVFTLAFLLVQSTLSLSAPCAPPSEFPFLIQTRDTWRTIPVAESLLLRGAINDSKPAEIEHFSALLNPTSGATLLLAVRRIPAQNDFLEQYIVDFSNLARELRQRGIYSAARLKSIPSVGEYRAILVELEKITGNIDLRAILFRKDRNEHVVEIMLLNAGGNHSELQQKFSTLLENTKINFDLSINLGANVCALISERAQRYLTIKQIAPSSSGEFVLVLQEPHWDYHAQWNLHQGLRTLFSDNVHLQSKTIFLAEGSPASESVSVAPLLAVREEPSSRLLKIVLESFLLTGYLTYNWSVGGIIPVVGTENIALYERSASLWANTPDAYSAWAATVSGRNESMVQVLLSARRSIRNPILFVGGMHLQSVPEMIFSRGQLELSAVESQYSVSNLGVAELLSREGLGYVYAVPIGDLLPATSADLIERYRDLFRAQIRGNYGDYLSSFITARRSAYVSGLPLEGVTVRSSPDLAASIVAQLTSDELASALGNPTSAGDNGASSFWRRLLDLLRYFPLSVKQGGKLWNAAVGGGWSIANSTFDRLIGGARSKRGSGGIRSAQLPDGTRVSVRPSSEPRRTGSGGPPTIQIDSPNGTTIKLRF